MQVVIHGINRKEKFSKKGEKFESLGIKYRGKWYSGFGSNVTKDWEVGMTVNIDLWEEPGSDGKMYGKFVVLISSKKQQEKKIDVLVNEETGEIEEVLEDFPDDQAIAEEKAKGEIVPDDLPF